MPMMNYIVQWDLICGTRTPGGTRSHLRGYVKKSYGVFKIERRECFVINTGK
jgi:hypothetical protein